MAPIRPAGAALQRMAAAAAVVATLLHAPAARPAAPEGARSPAAAPDGRASYPGVYRGYAAERFDGVVRTTQHVAVRDGAGPAGRQSP